jgi:hypothetical protein
MGLVAVWFAVPGLCNRSGAVACPSHGTRVLHGERNMHVRLRGRSVGANVVSLSNPLDRDPPGFLRSEKRRQRKICGPRHEL